MSRVLTTVPGKVESKPADSSRLKVPARGRSREKTTEELRLALLRLKNKALKVSISAVAREAGVDASLIHNTYPDIAEEIRAVMGRTSRRQRDEMRAKLTASRQRLREVTAERDQLKRELAMLASTNLTLSEQVAVLRAEVDGKLKRLGLDPLVEPASN